MGMEGEVPLSHTWVIGLLSVMNTILFPVQVWPQVKVAATMAYSSLKSMEWSCCCSWSHAP